MQVRRTLNMIGLCLVKQVRLGSTSDWPPRLMDAVWLVHEGKEEEEDCSSFLLFLLFAARGNQVFHYDNPIHHQGIKLISFCSFSPPEATPSEIFSLRSWFPASLDDRSIRLFEEFSLYSLDFFLYSLYWIKSIVHFGCLLQCNSKLTL